MPDPNATLAEYATAPALTGGLTTSGAGQFDIDELLSRVTVAPEMSASSYQRSRFEHWIDADGDSCDTRAEVLRTESSTPAQVDPSGCHVLTGDWLSIYDGYTTDDPAADHDHDVAAADDDRRAGTVRARTAPTAGSGCDPSYPGVCIPPAPPDLDCGDISYRRFEVRPPDPHGFDGDPDGIGGES